MKRNLTVEEYSNLKNLWKDDMEFIKYRFPVVALSSDEIYWLCEYDKDTPDLDPYIFERLRMLGYRPPSINYKKLYWELKGDTLWSKKIREQDDGQYRT